MYTLFDIRDIHSLTDFQRNAKKYVKKANKTGQPLVLTINGKPGVIVQDAESYQEMLDHIEYLRTVEAIRRGVQEHDEGKSIPWEVAKKQLREELGIQARSLKRRAVRPQGSAQLESGKQLTGRRRRVA